MENELINPPLFTDKSIQKLKSKKEIYVEETYRELLKLIEKNIENKDGTSDADLTRLALALINGFKGCVPRDLAHNIHLKENQCMIINQDTSKGEGIHWMGLYRFKNKNNKPRYLFYDSFARSYKSVILDSLDYLHNNVINADLKDREQKTKDLNDRIEETNCGERSLAFLVICDKMGFDCAKLI